jgi:hypothetical protein
MVEEFMESYTDNPHELAISAVAFLIGYLQYICAFRLVNREGSAPYPVWMHTFYFAHDFTGAVVFYLLAREHVFFWFFTGASIALIPWNCFEVYSPYMVVKMGRQEIRGSFHPCFQQPWFYITGVVVTLYGAHDLQMLLRFPERPVVDWRAPVW